MDDLFLFFLDSVEPNLLTHALLPLTGPTLFITHHA
jgi:hypothetical protein